MSDTDKPLSFDEWLKFARNYPPEKEEEALAKGAWEAGRILLIPAMAKARREGFDAGRASAEQADHTELVSRLEDIVDVYGYNLIREIDEAIRDAIAALKKESTP